MQTMINLPNALFAKSSEIAASRGETIEELTLDALAKEVGNLDPIISCGDGEVELPLIRSRRPGSLDLSNFDFDDLLA